MDKHSPMFQVVKSYYNKCLWSKRMVEDAVGRWIQDWEAQEILGGEGNCT